MHVLVVMSGVLPFPSGVAGMPVAHWSVVKTLLDRGHTVSICTYGRSRLDRHRDEAKQLLESMGVRVHDLDSQVPAEQRWRHPRRLRALRMALWPNGNDLFHNLCFVPALQQTIQPESPDALYVVDFNSAFAVSQLANRPPGLAAVTNLNHVALAVRRRTQPAKTPRKRFYQLLNTMAERRLPTLEVQALKGFERVVDHAAHHAEWLRSKGVAQCTYLPHGVADAVGSECHLLRSRLQSTKSKPSLLFIGRLDSTINQPALELLASEILPVLEAKLGPDAFVLDIVGQGELLPSVAARLERPWVRIRGYVEDAQTEFLSCHVLLVPTPSELGFRVRVAEGFSYGCCVVSHSSNALGMPELVHEDNALLASDGRGLAMNVVRVFRDSDLRCRLEHRARDTYEQKLDAGLICNRIAAELERIANH